MSCSLLPSLQVLWENAQRLEKILYDKALSLLSGAQAVQASISSVNRDPSHCVCDRVPFAAAVRIAGASRKRSGVPRNSCVGTGGCQVGAGCD